MATKNIDIVINAKDNASKAFESIWDKIKNNLTAISVVSWTVSAWLIALWKSAVQGAMKWETATTTMETMLRNTWHSSEEAIQSLEKLIKTEWKVWVISSSVSLAAAKQFATFDMGADAIAKILPAFNDYIAGEKWMNATTDDAINLANGLAKAMQWNFSSLTKAWRVIDEETASLIANWNEMERAEGLVKVLNSTYWGLNETLAQTTEARLNKLNSMFWSVKSQLWQALIPVMEQFLTIMENNVIPVVDKVAQWIQENPETTQQILLITWAVAGLTFAISTLIPRITSIITLMSWPAWRIIALTWVVAWLKVLDSKLQTTDEQIEWYQEELYNLTVAYNEGKIPLEEYLWKTEELNNKIEEARAKHETLTWFLQDNFIATLHSVMQPMDENNWWLRAWIDLLEMAWAWINSVAKTIKSVLVVALDNVISKMKELRDWAVKVADKIAEFAWSAKDKVSWRYNSAKSLVWFANGWNVQWNVPILVWERWPEVFVPNSAWSIIPNDELIWWTRINVNISGVSVRSDNDITALANEMIRQIKLEKQFWIS